MEAKPARKILKVRLSKVIKDVVAGGGSRGEGKKL